MKTIHDLSRVTGLTRHTLMRWQKADLLPKPEIRSRPKGRGRIGVYPDWAVQRCKRIQQFQSRGYSLEAVRAALAGDAGATPGWVETTAAEFVSVALDFEDGTRTTPLDRFVRMVLDAIEFPLPDSFRERIAEALRHPQVLRAALVLLGQGTAPVLISDARGNVKLLPEYLLGREFSGFGFAAVARDTTGVGRPGLVIGLWAPLSMVLEAMGRTVPLQTTTSAPKVWSVRGDKIVETGYLLEPGPESLGAGTIQARFVPDSEQVVGRWRESAEKDA